MPVISTQRRIFDSIPSSSYDDYGCLIIMIVNHAIEKGTGTIFLIYNRAKKQQEMTLLLCVLWSDKIIIKPVNAINIRFQINRESAYKLSYFYLYFGVRKTIKKKGS